MSTPTLREKLKKEKPEELKAIRLKLFQQLPSYRKPASLLVKETYPLPPYSTVLGMIHAACAYTTTHDMLLSVQGESAGEISDYSIQYSFGSSYEAGRHTHKVKNSKGKWDGITRGTKNIHELVDVNLTIYIVPEEKDYDYVLKGLQNPVNYLSLGRYEDLVRIEEIAETVLKRLDFDEEEETGIYESALIPINVFDAENSLNLKGSVYTLKKLYTLSGKSNLRNWYNPVRARYVPKEPYADLECFNQEDCYFDPSYTYEDRTVKNLVCLV